MKPEEHMSQFGETMPIFKPTHSDLDIIRAQMESEYEEFRKDTERFLNIKRQREQNQKRSKIFAKAFSWIQRRIYGI